VGERVGRQLRGQLGERLREQAGELARGLAPRLPPKQAGELARGQARSERIQVFLTLEGLFTRKIILDKSSGLFILFIPKMRL
jgi:hypothetical protein